MTDKGSALIDDLLDALQTSGFEVVNVGTRYRVTNPAGGSPTFVPTRLPKNGRLNSIVDGLAKIGFDFAEANRRAEVNRKARLAADREAGERALAEAAERAKTAPRPTPPPRRTPVRTTVPSVVPAAVEQYTEILDMTPELAASLLRANRFYDPGAVNAGKCNRKFRPWLAEEYAGRMLRGEWNLNHQGIGFDTDPSLIDGQHRLAAVVIAGHVGVPEQGLEPNPDIVVKMQVTYGLQPEAIDTVDSGLKRSISDVLGMHGEGNTLLLAGALRMIWLYDTLVLPAGTDIPYVVRAWHGRQTSMSVEQAQSILDEQPGIREAVATGGQLRHILLPSTACAAVHLIRRSWPESVTEPFIDGLLSGLGLREGTYVWALREAYLRQKLNRKYKRTMQEQLALFIKGWNNHLDGKTRNSPLTWRVDEAFPYLLTPNERPSVLTP